MFTNIQIKTALVEVCGFRDLKAEREQCQLGYSLSDSLNVRGRTFLEEQSPTISFTSHGGRAVNFCPNHQPCVPGI